LGKKMKPSWSEDEAVFELQDLVSAKYGEPDFGSQQFHCYADLPLAWRMPVMTNVFEGEIANGGLAQFLWNTFHHHKRILADARDGYELVGAPDHAAAISRCMEICSRFESGCRTEVEAATGDQAPSHFEQWYAEAESDMSFPEEELFESDSDIVQIKGRWILNHLDEYRELI
jgi:hypothetical protein